MAAAATGSLGEAPGLLKQGRNCWKIVDAPRASILVDAEAYFGVLWKSLMRAQRSIVIIGWDFDGRIKLRPETDDTELGPLLRQLVEKRSGLEVNILVWSVATIHAPSAMRPLLFGAQWNQHPRIHMRLDTQHPLYAAHHQKIVCIDGAVSFVGGIDLTIKRWDRDTHRRAAPERQTPDQTPYGPVHDVHMVVDGAAARCLRAVAAQRWHRATGEALPQLGDETPFWPASEPSDFTDLRVGIARTMPSWKQEPAITESAHLTLDALRSARRTIYIETQYLSCAAVGDVLAQRLEEPDGPEIVALVACSTRGFFERFVMGSNRDRLIRRLRRIDRHDRLRVYYPLGHEDGDPYEILVHSKLLIIDDDLVRIGSSNLSNRSRGLDTECDLAIEAQNAAAHRDIGTLRARLLAEHLGSTPERVAQHFAAHGSLIGTIDALNGGRRRLALFDAMQERNKPTSPIFATSLLDPAKPFRFPLRSDASGR